MSSTDNKETSSRLIPAKELVFRRPYLVPYDFKYYGLPEPSGEYLSENILYGVQIFEGLTDEIYIYVGSPNEKVDLPRILEEYGPSAGFDAFIFVPEEYLKGKANSQHFKYCAKQDIFECAVNDGLDNWV